VADAYPPPDSPYPGCPAYPPNTGDACYYDGLACGYDTPGGCGDSCECVSGVWSCYADPCPPPQCPPYIPSDGEYCSAYGSTCFYGSGTCGGAECYCDPSNDYWECSYSSCIDSGPPDVGPPYDGGIYDVYPSCPSLQPPENGSCDSQGMVCSYYDGCVDNCLCTGSGWVCAAQQPCASGDF
jgi:hypothetical protein